MMQTSQTGYFGKYRGKVVNNVDPRGLGRVQVTVEALGGYNAMNWAMPCVPYAGPDQGMFMPPPIGGNVWVEFEQGNLSHPIWSGCFWGDQDCPGTLPDIRLIKTCNVTITLDDLNPAAPVVIETVAGQSITLTAAGAEIKTAGGAKITLEGPRVVVNDGALEVI